MVIKKRLNKDVLLMARELILEISGVTEEEIKNKYFFKKQWEQKSGKCKDLLIKSKKIRIASQVLNFIFINRLKITSHQAAFYSFRKHPTPLIATKKILQELQYPSPRRSDIEKIINEFDKKFKFISS